MPSVISAAPMASSTNRNVLARRTTFVIDREGIVQQVFMAQEALDPAHALEVCALLKEVK